MSEGIHELVERSAPEVVQRYLNLNFDDQNEITTGKVTIKEGSRKSVFSNLHQATIPYSLGGVRGEVHAYIKDSREDISKTDWNDIGQNGISKEKSEISDSSIFEAGVLELSTKSGSPTPKFLGKFGDAIFMEDLGDRLLQDDLREDHERPDLQYNTISNVIEDLVKLHVSWKNTSIGFSNFNIQRRVFGYGEELIRSLEGYSGKKVTQKHQKGLTEGIETVKKYFTPFVSPEPGIIHGDLSPAHVSTEGEIKFFDLGRVRADVVLFDLADLLYYPLFNQESGAILQLSDMYRDERLKKEHETSPMSQINRRDHQLAFFISGMLRCLRAAEKSHLNNDKFAKDPKLKRVYDAYLQEVPEYSSFPQAYAHKTGLILDQLIEQGLPFKDTKDIISKYVPLDVKDPFETPKKEKPSIYNQLASTLI